MKHHNGIKTVNKLDGGKKEAKRAYHKALRNYGKEEIFDNKRRLTESKSNKGEK